MTANGWIQIAIFCAVVIAVTRPLGGYMTRIFNGDRTLLSPILRPVERAVYWCCGVDEKQEQSWLTYAVSMLVFVMVTFLHKGASWGSPFFLPFWHWR